MPHDNDAFLKIDPNSPMREIPIEKARFQLPFREMKVIDYKELAINFTPEFKEAVEDWIKDDYEMIHNGVALVPLGDFVDFMDRANEGLSDKIYEETKNEDASYVFTQRESSVYKTLYTLCCDTKCGEEEIYIAL